MKITISTEEHTYRGTLLRRDDDGILIDESEEKVFVPWDEILWVGKDLRENERAAKFRMRYRQMDWATVISIVAVGITAILIRRWLF